MVVAKSTKLDITDNHFCVPDLIACWLIVPFGSFRIHHREFWLHNHVIFRFIILLLCTFILLFDTADLVFQCEVVVELRFVIVAEIQKQAV